MPPGVDWRMIHGVSLLAGIGFTMSLFIGSLAFDTTDRITDVRLGVLLGSLCSAVCGFGVLRFATRGAVRQAAVSPHGSAVLP
jgi:NhaA family Na+:H+ antiporter